MRQFFLILALVSFCAWSQPASAPAQPPVVVQVQAPPFNPWMHIIDLVLPGIIGAALALLGVWFTNRTNEKTNAANRRHQQELERIKDEIAAEAKSRDNRWEFRKQVYSDLIRTISDLLVLLNESLAINRTYLENVGNPHQMPVLGIQLKDYFPKMFDATKDFFNFCNLSHIATADWLVQRILELTPTLKHQFELDVRSPDYSKNMAVTINNLNILLKMVAEAGRKDLWGAQDPKVNAAAASA